MQPPPATPRLITLARAARAILTALCVGCTSGAEPIAPGDDVEPGAATAANLMLISVQVTQAAQDTRNTVPMVAGAPAVINVIMARSRDTVEMNVPVVLRLFRGATLVRTDTAVSIGPLTRDVTTILPAVQFLLPDTLVRGELAWQVEIDPARTLRDSSRADNRLPLLGSAPIEIVTLPTMQLRMVPIILAAHGNAAAVLTPVRAELLAETVRQLLPTGLLSVSVAPAFVSQRFFNGPVGTDRTGFWEPLLMELDLIRVATGDPMTYWYGVVPVVPTMPLQFGGVALLGDNPRDRSGGDRTSIGLGDTFNTSLAYPREVLAHELGHNFGRRHAPGCNAVPPLDSLYPAGNGSIVMPGHDVWSMATGATSVAGVRSPDTFDIMSYCRPAWISAYNRQKVLEWRVAQGTLNTTRTARAEATAVAGRISATGEVTLYPALDIDAIIPPPDHMGDVTVELCTASGASVVSAMLTSRAVDHGEGSRHFIAVFPRQRASEAVAIRATTRDGHTAVRSALADVPTAVSARVLADGRTRYAAVNGRAMVLRDARTGDIVSIAWDGRAVMPSTIPVEITTSDGLHSRAARIIRQR
jgi:hypothetical protein